MVLGLGLKTGLVLCWAGSLLLSFALLFFPIVELLLSYKIIIKLLSVLGCTVSSSR